jgi:hypothetical protein
MARGSPRSRNYQPRSSRRLCRGCTQRRTGRIAGRRSFSPPMQPHPSPATAAGTSQCCLAPEPDTRSFSFGRLTFSRCHCGSRRNDHDNAGIWSCQVEPTPTAEPATARKKEGAFRSCQSRPSTRSDPTRHRKGVRPHAKDSSAFSSGHGVSRAGPQATPHRLGTVSRISGNQMGRRLPQCISAVAGIAETGNRDMPESSVVSKNFCSRDDRRGPIQPGEVASCRAYGWLPSGLPNRPSSANRRSSSGWRQSRKTSLRSPQPKTWPRSFETS